VAQSVSTGALVTLDGTGSTDADGDTLTYSWTLQSTPAGSASVLSSATAEKPTFTPDKAGSYVAKLTVSDGKASDEATVTITVTACPGDIFIPTVNYLMTETAVGVPQSCNSGSWDNITASISQTAGTCNVVFAFSTHSCQAELSGDSTNGYDVVSTAGGCGPYITASIHVAPSLANFTGAFHWTASCGTGTTTFSNVVKQ
jgi:PKD repeat protein